MSPVRRRVAPWVVGLGLLGGCGQRDATEDRPAPAPRTDPQPIAPPTNAAEPPRSAVPPHVTHDRPGRERPGRERPASGPLHLLQTRAIES